MKTSGNASRTEDKRARSGPTDHFLAQAFRDQEHLVVRLAGAAALMDIAVDATIIENDRSFLEEGGLRKDVLQDWHFYALTPEQADGLHHALIHMQDLVEELEKQFFAVLETREAAE